MTTETRTRMRIILKAFALVLGAVAIAVTFVPGLSGMDTYRVGFMTFALAALLACQALEPPKKVSA